MRSWIKSLLERATRGRKKGGDMVSCDLVVRDGDVILPSRGLTTCDIAISDGRIAAVLAPGVACSAKEEVSASGLVVFPGAVDAHLHLGHGRDIAQPRVALDANQETAAAARGGVTSFIPYVMATEPFDKIFPAILDVSHAGARIDFAYHFVISTEEQLASVPKYVSDLGVSTFKIFMNIRGGEGKRLGLTDIDDGFLLRLCEAAAASGGQVCPHPETIEMSWPLRDRLMAKDPDGKGGLHAWNGSRPPFVEADAIQHAAYVAGVTGTRMYIVHVSSHEGLEAGLRQRRSGSRIAMETCPHYLTHDVTWNGGDIGKINPPLREAADVEALWKGVLDGHIDTIATDHVHRDAGSKEGGIWKGSPGCPGLETLLPVVLSEGHHKRGLPLSRVADLVARNPARLMGLGDRKGVIEPSFDADLAFIDLNKMWTLEGSDTASSAGYSIYDGWKFKGEVVHTVVRGRWVLRDGALLDDAVGHGRYLHRQPFTSQI